MAMAMTIAAAVMRSARGGIATRALATATITTPLIVASRPSSRWCVAAVRCSSTTMTTTTPMASAGVSKPTTGANNHRSNVWIRKSASALASPGTMQSLVLQRRGFASSSTTTTSSSNTSADPTESEETETCSIVGPESESESDEYTVPIVIKMPPMDDVGGDESHCFVETWHKAEGDIVYPDDVLCDISTPDFVFGLQIDDAEVGLLKEVHVAEGVKVPDHTPLCTIYHKPPTKPDDDASSETEPPGV